MIWISSACPVGVRVAARLTDRTGVRLSAPRARVAEARTAVASLLGRDPGNRLEVQAGDVALAGAEARRGGVEELWHLSYPSGDPGDGELLAGRARQAGLTYRRFDLEPVAEGPDALVPGAFSTWMQALDETIQEVHSREPNYFEQRALRTTLPGDLALLDADCAAAEVLSAAAGPPGRCRIAASTSGHPPPLSDIIGEAYEVELVLGAEPSALSAVDRLFESRLQAASGAGAQGPVHPAGAADAAALERIVSAWRRHHATSHQAERARLAALQGTATSRSPAAGRPAFQVFGQSGQFVVIVNAIAQDLRYWGRLIDRLARDHRVVTWPMRTVRDDGQPATFDDHLRHLEAIAGEATEGPVHLIGWCTGPKLCARYALAHPRRVASMVFLAGTYRPFGDSSLDTPYEITLEMVFQLLDRSPGMASTVRATLLDAVSVDRSKVVRAPDLGAEVLARIDPDLLPSVVAPYATDESTLRYATQIRDFWSRSIEAEAGAIRAPVLVVGAELDRIASSRLGMRVAQALPDARFLELQGATHWCMHDRPDEVASVIRRFIDGAEP